MDSVAGHLCRKCEIQPCRFSGRDELVRRGERGLCLAITHWSFDHINPRLPNEFGGCHLKAIRSPDCGKEIKKFFAGSNRNVFPRDLRQCCPCPCPPFLRFPQRALWEVLLI